MTREAEQSGGELERKKKRVCSSASHPLAGLPDRRAGRNARPHTRLPCCFLAASSKELGRQSRPPPHPTPSSFEREIRALNFALLGEFIDFQCIGGLSIGFRLNSRKLRFLDKIPNWANFA